MTMGNTLVQRASVDWVTLMAFISLGIERNAIMHSSTLLHCYALISGRSQSPAPARTELARRTSGTEQRRRSRIQSKKYEAFDNGPPGPGVLSYRNGAVVMLLHTPLLINWVRDVHPEDHKCDEKDMGLVCAFWRLSTFYWLGDPRTDTHETYMKRLWDKLCATTWKLDTSREQDSWRFVRGFFDQLVGELENEPKRQQEVNGLFSTHFKSRRICQYCKRESPLRHKQVLVLEASFKKVALAQPSYKVAEAIQHKQQLGMPSDGEPTWGCGECNRPQERSNSLNPIAPLKYIIPLPEILFVRVEHTDSTGRTLGVLDLQDFLTIPADWQYPGTPRQDVQFELYSIIFQWAHGRNSGIAVESDYNICAVKGPGFGDKWRLVQNGLVSQNLTLDDLLKGLDQRQRPVFLAYRRLPLSGELTKPVPDPRVLIKQTISVREGVEWSFNQHVPFPDGQDRLSNLDGRARTHRAKYSVTIISEKTGEVLEGEATVSLAAKKIKRAAASAPTGVKKRGRPVGSVKTAKAKDKAKYSTGLGPNKETVSRRPSVKHAGQPDQTEATCPRQTTPSDKVGVSKASSRRNSSTKTNRQPSGAGIRESSTSKQRKNSAPKKRKSSASKATEGSDVLGQEKGRAEDLPISPPASVHGQDLVDNESALAPGDTTEVIEESAQGGMFGWPNIFK